MNGFDFVQRQEDNGGFGSPQHANRHTLISPTSRICPPVNSQIHAAARGTQLLQDLLQSVSEHFRDLPEEPVSWDR
jgi:hypothetical protein